MATIWVSTAGNNANDGSSYALAKADVWAAVNAAAKGDVINMVNDGDHPCGTLTDANNGRIDNVFSGTDFDTDPGLTIRGTDSSGNPAVTTVAAAVGLTYWIRMEYCEFITFQGLRFDYSAIAAATGTPQPFYCYFQLGDWRILDCEFLYDDATGESVNITNPAVFVAIDFPSATDKTVEVARCVFQHVTVESPLLEAGHHWDIHHCVFIGDADSGALNSLLQFGTSAGGTYHRVAYNTFISKRYGSEASEPLISASGDNTDLLRVHSNLFYAECGAGVSPAVNGLGSSILTGGVAASQTAAQTSGYDLFAIGPELTARQANWTSDIGYTSYQFDYTYRTSGVNNATILDPTSSAHTGVGLTDVFVSTGSWTWTPSDYDHTLPYDLRPIIGRTSALDGGVVGAIDDSINDPPVVNNPWPGAIDLGEVTAGSLLSVPAVSGLVTTAEDPDGDPMTYVLVDDVTHGTLTLNTTDGSFDYTPDATYEGDDGFTYNVCDGTTCTTRIVDSLDRPYASFIVLPFPVVPPGAPSPVPVEYLDVAPFFRPTLEVTTEFRLKTKKNRRKHHDLANYTERVLWNESMHRVINLATNTSMQVTLGGVEEAAYLIVETDNAINVSVNGDSNYWPVSGVVALALTTVTSLHIQNESTTNEAQVILAVSD